MLKLGIAGLGWWGRTLVRAARATGEIEIIAGATGRRALAEDFARDEGFALRDDLDALLAEPGIEGVILATPHLEHEAQIMAAAAAGKHVFVEKPITLTRAGALRATDAVAAAGLVIGLGHNRRFHPNMDQIRRRLASGDMGTLLHVEATMTAPNGLFLRPESWRSNPEQSPAGGMTGLGIHMVDAMIDLIGEITSVSARSHHRAAPIGSDDTTAVMVDFANGATGYVSCMTATAPYYRLCLYGSGGVAEIRGQGLDLFQFWPTPEGSLSAHAAPKPVQTVEIAGFDTVRAELAAFAGAVRGRAPFPIPPVEMVHGAAVFEAIIASARSGLPVRVAS